MAGGEGGFSTKAMGFDKKEVNEYIANLNQRMKEIEADKKSNDEKTQKALKAAQEADDKIKAIKNDSDKKIADLELQLKTERRNEENLLIQLDDLKRKLKQSGGSGAGSAKGSDKAATAAAEKKAAEIVANANATAKDIVEKANRTARDTVESAKATATKMITDAQGTGGGSVKGLDEFMSVLNNFISKVTSGVNEVNEKASELLGAESAEPVTVPDFSHITAPQAEAPAEEPAPKASGAKKSKEAAPAKSTISDDLFAAFDDDNTETNDDDDFDMISEVQPLDDPSAAPGAVVLEEFDLSNLSNEFDQFEEPVSEVKPIKEKKGGNAELSQEFETQILAQTANSSMLKNDMDDDLLAAVKEQEEQFAVKPSNDISGLDMDAAEDEDPLAAMLKQAELTFGSAANASDEPEVPEAPKPEEKADDSNPWAALQNELFAMEKSGDFGESETESDMDMSSAADPAAPSADDSSIWDFGENSSSNSDDDMGMSSDLFGGF